MAQPGRAALPAEQVLVASFSGGSPEVHVASLDAAQRVFSLQEACVSSGKVSLGAVKAVALATVARVEAADGVTTLVGHDRQPLVQLHLESPEDQRLWSEALNALIGGAGPAAHGEEAPKGDGSESDVHMLQARSQQLQTRIGTLEAISSRRDKQIQKMSRRLDGAMDMLAAVQDMCAQQRRVIEAQKDAIIELKHECGEATCEGAGTGTATGCSRGEDGASDAGTSSVAEEEDGASSNGGAGGQGEATVAEAEAEIAAKTQEMLRLLQQAEEMQRALRQLEGQGPSTDEPQEPFSPGRGPAAPAPSPVDADEDGTGRGRARPRFELMFNDAKGGHRELVERLTSMRSLIGSFRADGESAGSGSSDGGDGSARSARGLAAR